MGALLLLFVQIDAYIPLISRVDSLLIPFDFDMVTYLTTVMRLRGLLG